MTTESRRLRIDVAYDGTEFSGWQRQPGLRTVQGTLEATLGRLGGDRAVAVRGASRTDAGVHARQQVTACEIRTRFADRDVEHALRCMLPRDLRPLRVSTVVEGFHPRRSAARRTYRYRLDRSAHGDPFARRFALHHRAPIDRGALDEALTRLPGRRDWTGFAARGCTVDDRVRDLTAALYREEGERAWFEFTATGFLTHMVRNLVGTLLDVARGRFGPERVDEILSRGDRSLGGATAPPHGLCLWTVDYPDGDE